MIVTVLVEIALPIAQAIAECVRKPREARPDRIVAQVCGATHSI